MIKLLRLIPFFLFLLLFTNVSHASLVYSCGAGGASTSYPYDSPSQYCIEKGGVNQWFHKPDKDKVATNGALSFECHKQYTGYTVNTAVGVCLFNCSGTGEIKSFIAGTGSAGSQSCSCPSGQELVNDVCVDKCSGLLETDTCLRGVL